MPAPPLPVGDASLIDGLTVPVRAVEPKAAVAEPHAGEMKQEHQQRKSSAGTGPNPGGWAPKPSAEPSVHNAQEPDV